jgi:glucose 1-dehydrogenase
LQLENKAAAITGSSQGIGRAIALAFAREGVVVTVDYRSHPDEVQEVVGEIEDSGEHALAVRADVSDPDDVKGLIRETVQRFGRLDIMVNKAGVEEKMPFLKTPFEVYEKTVAVNLTGAWLGCQEAARQMVEQGEGGRIINVSSVHEDRPMPTNSPSCAAKGGLRMLMRTVAVELVPHSITVNNIVPGAIETPTTEYLKENPEQMEELLSEIPLGRIGKPEEGAELALYLASDAASYVTGATLIIDAGMMRQAGRL